VMNRRLIERLADATMTADAGVIAAWLHNLVAV
jgi:hypothetical protein